MIGFKNIPQNIRVPLFYAELDPSRANSGQINQRALIIGQILAGGTATPNVPVISQGVSDAKTAGGGGSMLHLMTQAYRLNDTFGEVWYLPLADDGAATAAVGSVAITAAPTANGTLYLYIGGVRIAQPVLTTQTTAQIATALAATINATPDLPVSATASTTIVTLTARNKGLAGNDIDLRLNYQGTRGGEVMPTGMTVTLTQPTGGATNPSLTTALANLGDQLFDFIVFPYTDTTSLDAMKTLLNDVSGRWSWSTQIYGHFFAAYKGTFGALATFGVARNDPHGSIMGVNDSPTPSWIWAAAQAGAAAVSLRADPNLPLQTIPIMGVLAPPLQSRFQLTDRNTLLFDGISTFIVGDDGQVYIENIVTTYQKNAFGNPDDSYLQVERMFLIAFVLRRLKTVVTSKYARVKLVENGTRLNPGVRAVTPNIIRADIIAQYSELEGDAYVQRADLFAKELIVEKSGASRVNVLWPGTLVEGLRIFALLFQFRTQ